MNRRWVWGLGIATVVLLIAALFGADRLKKDSPDAGPPIGTAGFDTPPAPGAPQPGEIAEVKTPRLEGTARSLAFEGRVRDLTRVELHTEIREFTEVFDAKGASLGSGSLTASGGPVVVEGDKLAVDGALTAKPGAVDIPRGTLVVSEGASIAAPSLALQTQEEPRGRPVPSPVHVRGSLSVDFDGKAVLGGSELQLAKAGGRVTLSWAGSGRIEVPKRPVFSGEWLGVKAKDLAVTLRVADLRLAGTHTPQQVYVNGAPQLRADKTSVDVVQSPPPVPTGGRGWFDWAPRNRGSVDMAIMKIGPGNPAGGWANLALDRLPAMFGGENRVPAGGDTSGMGKRGGGGLFGSRTASPIDAVILPGTADRESISFDVPDGTQPGRYELVIVLEGNFEPLRVVIPVEVVPERQQPPPPPP